MSRTRAIFVTSVFNVVLILWVGFPNSETSLLGAVGGFCILVVIDIILTAMLNFFFGK
jgi:hypothetical protein